MEVGTPASMPLIMHHYVTEILANTKQSCIAANQHQTVYIIHREKINALGANKKPYTMSGEGRWSQPDRVRLIAQCAGRSCTTMSTIDHCQ